LLPSGALNHTILHSPGAVSDPMLSISSSETCDVGSDGKVGASLIALASPVWARTQKCVPHRRCFGAYAVAATLLNRTRYVGEYSVGFSANQSNSANHDYQNNRQHLLHTRQCPGADRLSIVQGKSWPYPPQTGTIAQRTSPADFAPTAATAELPPINNGGKIRVPWFSPGAQDLAVDVSGERAPDSDSAPALRHLRQTTDWF